MIISFILYKLLKMNKFLNFYYRYSKNKGFIISRTPIECAIGIISPSGITLYRINEGVRKEYAKS